MVVLSLFDGMSCGQIALKELACKIDTYYASEVDKYAIHNTQFNFPSTIQLGDVRELDVTKLKPIDLLIGGSPCQSFSFVGKRDGMKTTSNEEITTLSRYLELKCDGFEFVGESYLFWEFMRVLREVRNINPEVKFLLENVEMGKKWENVITEAIGVEGIHLDSAIVSAQHRKRIYWTNIPYSGPPEDKQIKLQDILETPMVSRFDSIVENPIASTILKMADAILLDNPHNDFFRIGIPYDDYNSKFPKDLYKAGAVRQTFANRAIRNGFKVIQREMSGELVLRKFFPIECARLQTIPVWYDFVVPERQIYKLLGNGWTVEIIKHLLEPYCGFRQTTTHV